MKLDNESIKALIQKADASQRRRAHYALHRRQEHTNNARNKRDTTSRHGDVHEDPGAVSNYRNRALERSQLKDEYYLKVEQEYQQMKSQTIEESRYMGGDVERAHLVKGLDYVLLRKIKDDMQREPIAVVHNADTAEDENQQLEARIAHTELGFYIYKCYFYHTNYRQKDFRQRFHNTFEMIKAGHKMHRGLPSKSRTFYKFNLKLEPDENDIPNATLYYSGQAANETDGNRRIYNVFIAPNLRAELADALQWHEHNKKLPKEQRLSFRPAATNTGPVAASTMHSADDDVCGTSTDDDNDDIFENVPKYKSDDLDVLATAAGGDGIITRLERGQSYFDGTDEEGNMEGDSSGFRPPRVTLQRIKAKATQGAYDECYPEVAELLDAQDDEGDGRLSKCKRRRKRKSASTS